MAIVLYVDDEASIRRAVHYWLAHRGHDVHTARSVAGAKRCIKQFPFECIFIDVWLGDGSAMDLYGWIREQNPRLADATVFVTGDSLMRAEMHDRLLATSRPILDKPFDLSDLDTFVQKWDSRRSLGVAGPSGSSNSDGHTSGPTATTGSA